MQMCEADYHKLVRQHNARHSLQAKIVTWVSYASIIKDLITEKVVEKLF